MKPEDERVFRGHRVIASADPQQFEAELFVERQGRCVRGPDLKADKTRPPECDLLYDLPKHLFADPQPPEIGVDGDIVDLDILTDQPEDHIADDLVERFMDDDLRKRDRTMLDLSFESGFVPGMGKGQFFYLQDGAEVRYLHPPEVVELIRELDAFYFLSSAWDLR